MAGLAASTIRLPGWKPPVISSRSWKPDGVPGERLPSFDSRSSLSISSWSISSIDLSWLESSSWPARKMACSACSTRARGSPPSVITRSWISRALTSSLRRIEWSRTIFA